MTPNFVVYFFWGTFHVFASGDLAKLILFGSLTVLALASAWHMNIRCHQELGITIRSYEERTFCLPL